MQIEVKVQGQKIERLNSPGAVEDTLNYLTCHFTFDGSEWKNTIKTAYFKNRATEKIYSSLIADDGTCTVPWESLTDKGFVEFSAAGERENYRITTGIESFYNSKTVYGGEPSEPPTPDQYDQLIALAQETKEIAESVREDANEGKFDGEPGKQGNPGRDGVSPTAKVEQTDDGAVITITDATGTTTAELKNGKEGNPGQNATDEQVRGAVDAYMAEHPVQGDTEDIIKLAIKNEASGAVPVVIADSAEMGVQDLEMQGWTEQDSTEGKNLFDKSEIVLSGTTITYMPVNVGDGEYTLSTNYIAPGRNDVFFLPGNVNTGASSSSNGVQHGTSRTVTSENGYVTVALRLGSDGTTSPLDYQIMLNEGSTALPYEPYTGGQPSPNPDYPQEITSAGKYDEGTGKYEYEVKLTAKNVFVLQDLVDKVAETSNPAIGVILTITGLKPGTRYTLSASIDGSTSGDYLNRCLYLGGNDGGSSVYNGHPVTKTTDSNGDIQIWFYGGRNESQTILDGQGNVQLEEGVSATEYEAYKEQLVTLTADRPLTKWDKLEKRNGQWGWVRKSAEITLDGSEYWMLYTNNKSENLYGFQHNISNLVMKNIPEERGFIDKIPSISQGISSTNKMAAQFGYLNTTLYILLPREYFSEHSVSALTEWLSENPLMVLYETGEETFVPLSESEQEQMNALHTYYPTTVLSNDTECEMTIKYIADTKAYIDNKIAAIQAAIVNTI